MNKVDNIRIYENNPIRTIWDEEKKEWYFSVVDVVGVLTDSKDPKQYIKKMRSRDPELSNNWGTICTPVKMKALDGKQRQIQAADIKGILRIIQSIPSPKAEPFKLWLAQVGSERIEETIDPELSIDRGLQTYLKKGSSEDWIYQRLFSIRVRNDLTKQWDEHGIEKADEYAILTDEITRAWAGMSTREYKELKNLKKENLRDNMSDLELVLNMLAEASTSELTKVHNPQGLMENSQIAKRGGMIARDARQAIENDTGKSIVTSKNLLDFTNAIEMVNTVIDTDESNNIQ